MVLDLVKDTRHSWWCYSICKYNVQQSMVQKAVVEGAKISESMVLHGFSRVGVLVKVCIKYTWY